MGNNYYFRSLKTYASNEWMANATKKFRTVFDKSELNGIGVVLSFFNTKFNEETWGTTIEFKCSREFANKNEELFSLKKDMQIPLEENECTVYESWKPGDKKDWQKGTYKWEVFFDGVKAGEAFFYIENTGKVTPTHNPFFELNEIKLYKGGADDVALENREYLKVFNKDDTRYVWVQLDIENKVSSDWFAEVFYNFIDDTGMLKEQVTSFNFCQEGNEGERFLLSAGWGADKPGYWLDDYYYIHVVFMDCLIAKVKLVFGEEDVEGQVINLLEDEQHENNIPPNPAREQKKEEDGDGTIEDTMKKLNALIGLDEVKTKIEEFGKYVDFIHLRESKGFDEEEDFKLHSIFKGNPGTGKTTVVKLLGKIFKQKGLLSKGHVHEVDRAALVGEYIGQTAPRTKKAIDKARGGILFIDEAYMLARDSERDFGKEALEVFLKEMSDGPGDIAIMAAGYPDEMQKFLDTNPGLASRFRYHYYFEDYTPDELFEIAMYAAREKEISFTKLAREELKHVLTSAYRERDKTFGNARFANFIVDQAKLKMGLRVLEYDKINNLNKKALSTILPVDVQKIKEEIPPKRPYIPTDQKLLNKSLAELDNLLGLHDVKEEVKELVKLVAYYRDMGQNVLNRYSFHTVFSGNPGTGKTTVARIIGNIYKALGILERGHVVETGREGLVAGYVGQTAIKTKEVIDEAMDGILFIDEAYALSRNQQGSNNFGEEAIEVILKNMEDKRGRFVLIAAGYPGNMHEFLESNPGLKSRFDTVLTFPDYSAEELYQIGIKMLNNEKLYLEEDAAGYLKNYMEHLVKTRDKYFGNAREVRKLIDEITRNQNLRMADLPREKRTNEALSTVIFDDVDDFVVKPVVKRPTVGFKRGN
jgi:SpoVK/Ycf46/Vps4 family AAA+-type ATPase